MTTTITDPPAVPTLKVGELTYRLPFASLLRPHTPAERAALLASVKRFGVKSRVILFNSRRYGPRCVVDGALRLWAAGEADRDFSAAVMDLSDADAWELAVQLNACRRRPTLAEQRAARGERLARVRAMSEAGRSLRAIAAVEGVSHEQIRLDLKQVSRG